MFDQIIRSLPPDPAGVVITLLVAVGIGIGALTSLLGALHSRPTMAIIMLSIGAVLGYAVPGWIGWDVNRSAVITGAAVIFGLTGFILHRFCVAFALAVLVMGVSLCILHDQTQPVDKSLINTVQLQPAVTQSAYGVWQNAPERFRSLAPWVGGAAFIAAAGAALVFPRFGMALLYSLGGTVVTLFAISLGHASDKIHWLDSIKTGPMTLAALGMAMLLVGFLTQMVLLYRPAPEKKPAEKEPAHSVG